MSQNAILLSGDLSVDILDENGKSTGFQTLEADVLKVTPKSDIKEATSRRRATYGQNFAQVVVAKPSEFELRLTEITRPILAAMLAATIEPVKQLAGVVAPVSVKAIVGRFVDLGVMQLASAKVTNAAGDVTYAEGADYTLDLELGMVQALSGGAIKDGDALEVTPTRLAYTGSLISGAKRHQYKMVIKLNGRNMLTNETVIFEAGEAVVTPSEAQDFLDDKLMTGTLKGNLNVPKGKTAPYTVLVLDQG